MSKGNNKSLILLTLFTTAIIVGGLLIFSNGAPKSLSSLANIGESFESGGVPILRHALGQTVMAYTDENEGEDLIIRSDRKVYSDFSNASVYFSVTNENESDQKVELQFYFPETAGEVERVEAFVENEWQLIDLRSEAINEYLTKYSEALHKKKPVNASFLAKGKVAFDIEAGETEFFRMRISYPPSEQDEFWFEAFGDAGGYGLLDPWYASGWTYRSEISIDPEMVSGSADLNYFPLLVDITDVDLIDTSRGGKVASGSGGDILFTINNGTTKIDHEIESYNSVSGELVAWVEVPTISWNLETNIYMYYGNATAGINRQENPTGVWDSNFLAVYHLAEDPSITTDGDCGGGTKEICDSTSNNIDGDPGGSMSSADQIIGQVNGSLDLDGGDDYVDLPDVDFGTNDFTFSMWVNPDVIDQTFHYLIQTGLSGDNDLAIMNFREGLVTKFILSIEGSTSGQINSADDGTVITPGTWWYLVGVFDRTNNEMRRYVNGSQSGSSTDISSITGNVDSLGFTALAAGNDLTANQHLQGKMDEARISDIARSVGWIATEYNNQAFQTMASPSNSSGFRQFVGMGGAEKMIRDPDKPSIKISELFTDFVAKKPIFLYNSSRLINGFRVF